MDWPAIIAGAGAIVTAALGVSLAIREARRHDRRAAERTIRELELDLEACRDESVTLHRRVHELRTRLAELE